MLAEAAQALRGTRSYHVSGMLDPGLSIDIVVSRHGSTGRVTSHGVTWDEIGVDTRTWFRGRALWNATLPAAQADALGDDWVLVSDPSAAFGFAGPLHDLQTRVPGVVFGRQPGLSNRGTKKLNGQEVLELANATDIYDVLTSGVHYPVRWLETEIPGPDGKPCGITLDRFGDPSDVVAPATDKKL
ncbi:MAG: hypothetical protein QOK05_574 [Chloroflexota bacterium]|nr:hypothetical protein [Chloroflexota bacterium]